MTSRAGAATNGNSSEFLGPYFRSGGTRRSHVQKRTFSVDGGVAENSGSSDGGSPRFMRCRRCGFRSCQKLAQPDSDPASTSNPSSVRNFGRLICCPHAAVSAASCNGLERSRRQTAPPRTSTRRPSGRLAAALIGIEGRYTRMCGIFPRVSRRIPVGSEVSIWHPPARFVRYRMSRVALFGSPPDG